MHAALKRLLEARLDPARTANVDTLTLLRGAARFRFKAGDFYRASAGAGPLQVAAYIGSGDLDYAPPLAFERAELMRYFHTEHVVFPFQSAVLLWADSTGEGLDRALHWGPGKVAGPAADELDQVLKSLGHRALDAEFMEPLLSGRHSPLFVAYVQSEDDRALLFEMDPTRFEDERLLRVPRRHFLTADVLSNPETVCWFPSSGRYDSTAVGDVRPIIRVPHIDIDCTVTDGLSFSAVASLTVIPLRGDAEWFGLDLDPLFAVDSLSWDGQPVEGAYRARDNAWLWVRPGGALGTASHTLRVAYRGELLESVGDWILPRTWTDWYPRPASWNDATLALTFRTPKQYLLASVGEQEGLEISGHVQTSRWAVRRPTSSATFVIGRFEKRSLGDARTLPIQALFYKGKPRQIAWTGTLADGTTMSMVEGARMRDWVAEDAVRCAAFYHELLGPPQVAELTVMQIPALRGEAFPGMVNIPETPFVGATGPAEDLVFRAHEVAHQWWGYTLTGRTYHDHWLSEGFADYSALLYLQKSLARGSDYLAVLRDWKEQLFEDEATRPEKGHPAGPIWLGTRNAAYERPADYALIDYKKGAWVLHMLRFLMIDLQTLDDTPFTATLQDFFRTYAGGRATTDDFRRTAERHYGADLGWFFDQWVYGTALPTYEFSYRTDRTPEGKSRVTCRVHRKDSGAPLRLPVIIRIDLGSDRIACVRHVIETADAEFTLPLLDEKPARVEFNAFESALCRVEEGRWR